MAKKYKELSKIKYKFPYFYKITKGSQSLYYVGASHSFDPGDGQFPRINKYWRDFLKTTAKEDRVVLVEGGNRPVLGSMEEAIKAGGEAHLLSYLADK